jgi:phosphatidate cytidylyltransferase
LVVTYWLLRHRVPKNTVIMAATGWVVLMPAWLALVSLRRVSPLLVLALVATVCIADSAAYLVGKRFGRHKLAPLISPGKTWEGVLGAAAAVTLYGTVLCLVFELGLWTLVGLWGVTVLSIVGDLFESLLKRQAGLKDSGTSLPGHGGVLDRIDGLTAVLPLAALYTYLPLYCVTLADG